MHFQRAVALLCFSYFPQVLQRFNLLRNLVKLLIPSVLKTFSSARPLNSSNAAEMIAQVVDETATVLILNVP